MTAKGWVGWRWWFGVESEARAYWTVLHPRHPDRWGISC
jgi:hypothetical protein